MKTVVFIVWRIRSLSMAIIRNIAKTVVWIMVRGEVTDSAARPAIPTGGRCPYAGRRLSFLKYAPYTGRDGIRR